MLSVKTVFFALLASSALAAPVRREVPQEHSHEQFLKTVGASLNLNNPDQIQDSVFGLLGNAAAAKGQGKITNTDCLQQATADQAFTNAKAKGDVAGMTAALIYRALERNTGKVGLASVACTAIKAKNPEIAAISQHQDPASAGAAATNKAITLALAKQIAAVGGDPTLALKAGTFKAGSTSDNTGKGNTCDDANDATGCIFTQNLIVEDATAAEIQAAVKGIAAATPAKAASSKAAAPANNKAKANKKVKKVKKTKADKKARAASGNLQKFTGALGGLPPPVTTGGKGFVTDNSDFLNLAAAIGRSCDVQHNACAKAANSKQAGVKSVSQCDQQDAKCRAQ